MVNTAYTHWVSLTSDFRTREQIVEVIGDDFMDYGPHCDGDVVTILTTEANASKLVSHGCRAELAENDAV